MKKITIFTDPHLGTRRSAHTTRSSADRLRSSLYSQAMSIVYAATNPVLCAGDLLDKACNDEQTMVQAYNVASRCQATLSGNHDELNRSGTTTTLQALKEMGVSVCSAPDLSTAYFDELPGGIYMVPHHASQELFLEACYEASHHAGVHREGQASYLFLHCNYNFPMKLEDNTLNMPEETAKDLLGSFDYIFIGHEHNPSKHLDDRVVILGNCHPTSFSDISDKFIYHLELETATLTEERVWSKSDHYRQLTLGDDIPDLDGVQFVEVIGNGGADDAMVVNDYLQAVWKASFYQPEGEPGVESGLFAVRNNVTMADALAGLDTDVEAAPLETLSDLIQKDLAGSALLPLYKKLYAEVTA